MINAGLDLDLDVNKDLDNALTWTWIWIRVWAQALMLTWINDLITLIIDATETRESRIENGIESNLK